MRVPCRRSSSSLDGADRTIKSSQWLARLVERVWHRSKRQSIAQSSVCSLAQSGGQAHGPVIDIHLISPFRVLYVLPSLM